MNVKSTIQDTLEKTILGHWAKFIVQIDQNYNSQTSVLQRINHYFCQQGFSSIGDAWEKISYAQAFRCIEYCIGNSIVYHKPLCDEQLAKDMANDFMCEFPKAEFFTNLKPYSWHPFVLGDDWTSVGCEDYMDPLGWQFEHGIAVIAYDGTQIGLFCKLECD